MNIEKEIRNSKLRCLYVASMCVLSMVIWTSIVTNSYMMLARFSLETSNRLVLLEQLFLSDKSPEESLKFKRRLRTLRKEQHSAGLDHLKTKWFLELPEITGDPKMTWTYQGPSDPRYIQDNEGSNTIRLLVTAHGYDEGDAVKIMNINRYKRSNNSVDCIDLYVPNHNYLVNLRETLYPTILEAPQA